MTKKLIQARDLFGLTSRHITDEGYLVAPGNLGRTGVQEYLAHELGLDADGMDPMRVIRLHRPAEEVFDAASMASFENKPITIEHPAQRVTSANWSELARGEVRDVARSGELLTATLLLKARDAIDALKGGKVQLSNGYSFELDLTPGTTADGQPFDGVQRNIRGNHVALVDAARCGSACSIADSEIQLSKGATTMAVRKVIIDGIPFDLEEAAAAAVDKLAEGIKTGLTNLKAATDALAEFQTKHAEALAAKDAQMEAVKKDVVTPAARDAMVAEWAKLIADGKRLVPNLVTDGKTCLAIRREVITAVAAKDATAKAVADAVMAGKTVETADADVIRATFNALAAAVKTETADEEGSASDTAVADALMGKGAEETKLIGRDAFLNRQRQAWQQ